MTWKARPTTYKGIKMRSRLEARMAAKLDADGLVWEYEPRAYADETGQYLPDFELPPVGERAESAFIEVKPTRDAALAAINRMSIIWSSLPGARLYIAIGAEDMHFCGVGGQWSAGHWSMF